jgi:hypothetical protein
LILSNSSSSSSLSSQSPSRPDSMNGGLKHKKQDWLRTRFKDYTW